MYANHSAESMISDLSTSLDWELKSHSGSAFCILNQCINLKVIYILISQRLMALVQPGDWLTTIDLKACRLCG